MNLLSIGGLGRALEEVEPLIKDSEKAFALFNQPHGSLSDDSWIDALTEGLIKASDLINVKALDYTHLDIKAWLSIDHPLDNTVT